MQISKAYDCRKGGDVVLSEPKDVLIIKACISLAKPSFLGLVPLFLLAGRYLGIPNFYSRSELYKSTTDGQLKLSSSFRILCGLWVLSLAENIEQFLSLC